MQQLARKTTINLEQLADAITTSRRAEIRGRVIAVRGPVVRAQISQTAIGDLVELEARINNKPTTISAQVVGFEEQVSVLTPLGSTEGLFPGALARTLSGPPELEVGDFLLGAVVDALGRPLASGYSFSRSEPRQRLALLAAPPPPLDRAPINRPFQTGIRSIDGFVTLGVGQRLVVLAEPGVGKSTLMAMIARNSEAEVNVIGLIGERGREVNDFLRETLTPEARKRTIVVVATSDEAAICRVYAANTATRIAEYFRDRGRNVLLQIDSLTRLFRAYREVGLAAGEMPVRRGYPPSVFAALPRLLERAGTSDRGSITALYTLLLSSDLEEDPLVEEVKGLTDGHLYLRRDLAERGQYPACDIVNSLSRLANRVISLEHRQAAARLRAAQSRINADRELLLLGGTPDAELTKALGLVDELREFLTQPEIGGSLERIKFEETVLHLEQMSKLLG